MKTFFVASTLVGAVLAQELGTLPSCATACLVKFTTGNNIGSCSNINAACICADKNFLNGIACCLVGACSASDQASAVEYASKLCSAQGVTVPSAVTCSSSSSSAGSASGTGTTAAPTGSSTTAAPTGSSTTAAASTTTAGANTVSSTSKPNAANTLATPGPELIGGLLAALALL